MVVSHKKPPIFRLPLACGKDAVESSSDEQTSAPLRGRDLVLAIQLFHPSLWHEGCGGVVQVTNTTTRTHLLFR